MLRHIITPDPDNAVELRSLLTQLEEHADKLTGVAGSKLGLKYAADESYSREVESISLLTVQEIIENGQLALTSAGSEDAIIDAILEAQLAVHSLQTQENAVPVPEKMTTAIEDNDMELVAEEIENLAYDIVARLEGEIDEQLRLATRLSRGLSSLGDR